MADSSRVASVPLDHDQLSRGLFDPMREARDALIEMLYRSDDFIDPRDLDVPQQTQILANHDTLLVLLPLLIVLSSLLFLLLLFLVCVLFIRRRRGIILRDNDGPVDMSREELIDGEGGFDGIEERWLESVSEETRRAYRRAKDYQLQYPPNSLPTDITLSQFLSIQEKGVSAWSFDPDYEMNASLLVHARTELTFLPDPLSATSVQSNLPLPKLNEVYYWEVKMFDLPETTSVAIGLATKPYPVFSLPGMNRYSIAYHSNGDKSHNYPFTAQQYGPRLKEGDVLGVGYKPRTGTVFFTRNGRKMEDAFIGLTRWNLFPTVGADGPCSLHVNLGQSGFVFVEANVKKWGLAPSVGTLAPPPAYGSERGSILLEAGGGVRGADGRIAGVAVVPPASTSSHSNRRSHRSRRSRHLSSSAPAQPSPLRSDGDASAPLSPPPPITPILEEDRNEQGTSAGRYISPTDTPVQVPALNLPQSPPDDGSDSGHNSRSSQATSRAPSPSPTPTAAPSSSFNRSHSRTNSAALAAAAMTVRLPPPDSPMANDMPPTPLTTDIHLQSLSSSRLDTPDNSNLNIQADDNSLRAESRPPPAYSPLDAYRYSDGVHVDLPAEVIAAALEGGSFPTNVIGQGHHGNRTERQSRRRERRH